MTNRTSPSACQTLHLFEFHQGTDVAYDIEFCEYDNQTQTLDITGWEFKLVIKSSHALPDAEATIRQYYGPLSGLDAESGVFYIRLSNQDTAKLGVGTHYMTLTQNVSGILTRVVEGTIKVLGKTNWQESTNQAYLDAKGG